MARLTAAAMGAWTFALASSCACAPLAPVARYPWVEDSRCALVEEELVIEVLEDAVAVDARFDFRGGDGARKLSFPVPDSGGPAVAFEAVVVRSGGAAVMLHAEPGEAGMLPVAGAGSFHSWDIFVPAGAFERGSLHVRYRQPGRSRFDYVLSTGAYWRGPIGRLVVEVIDRGHRVVAATVEGRAPDRVVDATMRWDLGEVEPRSGATLELR